MARTIEQELKGLRQRLRQLKEKDGRVGDELPERGADPKPSDPARAVCTANKLLLEHTNSGPSED